MKTAIVLGTSRSDGNTRLLVDEFADGLSATVFDLAHYEIGFYDYQHQQNDDFIALMSELIHYDRLIMATPVYWYAMSAQMKVFIDRFSDLITIRKDLGRKLAGKSMALLSTGSDKELPEGFEVPFQLTASYFDMEFTDTQYRSVS